MLKNFFKNNRVFSVFLLSWTLFFIIIRTLQHYSFGTNACDLSIFDYGIYYTLKGKIMFEPFHGYWGSHFAIHFTPIIFFIVPFYLFLKAPLFLLYLQVLAIALSAIPLYLITKHEFNNKFIASSVSIIYLLYRFVLNGLMYDFHVEMFFPLFFFSAYYFLIIKKNIRLFFVFFALSLFIKEDIAIYLFFFGLFLIFKGKKYRKIGLIVSLCSILYFIISVMVIIPYFRNSLGFGAAPVYTGLWDKFGTTPFQIIKNIVSSPTLIFKNIAWGKMIGNFSNLFLPLGLIPCFSSFALLIIPPVFVLITSNNPLMSGFALYYSITIIPFLFLSFILGLKNFGEFFLKKSKTQFNRNFRIIVIILILVNLSNTKWNVLRPSNYYLIKYYKTMKKVINSIPANSSIASLSSIIPHIPKRRNMHMLPEIGNADYILIHMKVNRWPLNENQMNSLIKKLFKSNVYLCIYNGNNILLFKKRNLLTVLDK